MKSPVTREKYQKRLGKFLDFLGLEDATIQEKSRAFVEMARKDSNWTFNSILRFVQFQNDRVLKKEITSATVSKGNGTKYPEIVVNWASGVPTTIRVDGFENVDIYACNAREIIPPLVDQKKEKKILFTNLIILLLKI
jgi:hypothetical protein